MLLIRRMTRERLSSMILIVGLTACAPTTDFGATDSANTVANAKRVACDAFEPITWSSKDTDATIRTVKGHNATYLALCGKR
jgi:hypothetical protein